MIYNYSSNCEANCSYSCVSLYTTDYVDYNYTDSYGDVVSDYYQFDYGYYCPSESSDNTYFSAGGIIGGVMGAVVFVMVVVVVVLIACRQRRRRLAMLSRGAPMTGYLNRVVQQPLQQQTVMYQVPQQYVMQPTYVHPNF